jgi:hypothetical protein
VREEKKLWQKYNFFFDGNCENVIHISLAAGQKIAGKYQKITTKKLCCDELDTK